MGLGGLAVSNVIDYTRLVDQRQELSCGREFGGVSLARQNTVMHAVLFTSICSSGLDFGRLLYSGI